MTEQRPFLDQLTAVERAAVRSVLREVIRLAELPGPAPRGTITNTY